MPEPRFAGGLSALADRYDAFVLDQWGVLHDGANPYPGAIAAVEELVRRGKKVALLSNSGRRAAKNRERMASFGFDPDWFAAIVTSGEACWRLLHDRPGPPWDRLGRRCHLLTIGGDLGVVEGLDLELVDDPARSDFILASGLETWQTPEDLRPVAEAGTARGLPLVCSNPDIVAVSPGHLLPRPAAFATPSTPPPPSPASTRSSAAPCTMSANRPPRSTRCAWVPSPASTPAASSAS